ncbi:hypothetical protein RJ639_012235 [Escallonia herrerae]|uniref:Plastocyanin-like domain-containing protein n=1 Tax=Escallonia herrerae TaxID=1293975 RepID=A0AA88VPN1_9ASTE|nr:hypothetical protein RJ639_012235 [Escallonia herrerae]
METNATTPPPLPLNADLLHCRTVPDMLHPTQICPTQCHYVSRLTSPTITTAPDIKTNAIDSKVVTNNHTSSVHNRDFGCVLAVASLGSKTRHFKWQVEYLYWSPDGVENVVMGINGRFPGPTIRAKVGDTISVHLTNINVQSDQANSS